MDTQLFDSLFFTFLTLGGLSLLLSLSLTCLLLQRRARGLTLRKIALVSLLSTLLSAVCGLGFIALLYHEGLREPDIADGMRTPFFIIAASLVGAALLWTLYQSLSVLRARDAAQ